MVGFPKFEGGVGVHHDTMPQPIVTGESPVVRIEALDARREEEPAAIVEEPKGTEVLTAEGAKMEVVQFVGKQVEIAKAREALMRAAPAPRPAFMPEAPAYKPEPIPKVDPERVINIPIFGDAQFLFVDPDSGMMYFATPTERARVDATSMGNEPQGFSSRDLVDFSPGSVVALTPGQVRELLAKQPSSNSEESAAPAQAANTKPWSNRYAA